MCSIVLKFICRDTTRVFMRDSKRRNEISFINYILSCFLIESIDLQILNEHLFQRIFFERKISPSCDLINVYFYTIDDQRAPWKSF